MRGYEKERGGGIRHITTGFVHKDLLGKGEEVMNFQRVRCGTALLPGQEPIINMSEPAKDKVIAKLGGLKLDGAGTKKKPARPSKKNGEGLFLPGSM